MIIVWVNSKVYYLCDNQESVNGILDMLYKSRESKAEIYTLKETIDLRTRKFNTPNVGGD